MPNPILLQKNIVKDSTINAETVHIGDKNYYVIHQKELENTILFLKITKNETNQYTAQLQINGKDQQQALSQIVPLELEDTFFKGLNGFENYKRQRTGRLINYRNLDGDTIDRDAKERNQQQKWEAALGIGLYQKCLPENSAIRQLFEQFLDLLKNKRIRNLTLVISSSEATILNIPFELMRQAANQPPLSVLYDNLLICHSQTTQLAGFEQAGISEVALPLRLLFVTALPWNADGQFIDLEKEQELIFDAIDTANKQIIKALGDLPSNRRIVVEFLEVGSLAEIERALIAGKHHILHISGHGFFFDIEGKGFLNLENEEGGLAQVSGEELAKVLQPFKQHLKLVLFAACETARAEEAGIAGALMAIGVPAILAMRYPVLDRTATLFTATFYQHLCKGATLSESLFFARKAILDLETEERKEQAQIPSGNPNNKEREWFTPFLYLNQYIGRLINPNQPIEEAAYFFQQHRSTFFFKGVKNEKLERSPAKLVAKGFVGRRRQLAKLTKLFRDRQRIICLHGIGGIGKTSLAARFLDNYQNKGFTIIPFVGEVTEHQILTKIVESANEAEQTDLLAIINDADLNPSEKLNFLINGYLVNEPVALFFDNFEDNQGNVTTNNDPIQLKSVALSNFLATLCQKITEVPTDKKMFLLFTTRYKISASFTENIHFMDVAKMDFPDTYKLISRSKGLVHLSLTNRQQVHERLGGHPRAMELLDSYFRNTPKVAWEAVAEKFAKVEDFLARHDLLLDWLWGQLTEEERYVLSVASIYRQLTELQGITVICEGNHFNYSLIISKLNNLSLLYLEKDKFYVHRLTSQWLAQFIEEKEKMDWHDQAGEFLLFRKTDETGNAVIHIDDGPEVRRHFYKAKNWEKAADITMYLEDAYRQIGHFDICLNILEALKDKPISKDNQIQLANRLGIVYRRMGNFTQAIQHYEDSIKLCRQTKHIQGQIANLRDISTINMIIGDREMAKENLMEAGKLVTDKSDLMDELASSLLQLGTIFLQEGTMEQAETYYLKALGIAEHINDQANISNCIHQLGRLNESIGNYDKALSYYQQSLELSDQLDDVEGMGISLHHIGTIHLLQDNLREALKYTLESLRIAETYQDINSVAYSHSQLGTIYRLLGDYSNALSYFEKGYNSALKIGNIEGVISGLVNIGIMHQEHLENEKALTTFQLALQQAKDYDFPVHQGHCLHQMGNIYLEVQEDTNAALACYEEALEIYTSLNDAANLANTYNQLGTIAIKEKEYKKARTLIEEAMAIREKLEQKGGIISCIYNLGELAEEEGDLAAAKAQYLIGLKKSEALQNHKKAAEGYNFLSMLAVKTENYQEALETGTMAVLLLQQINAPSVTLAAQNVLELEAYLPVSTVQDYLKANGLDIRYIESSEE